MSCDKVNGLEETDGLAKGESYGCCNSSSELTQVRIRSVSKCGIHRSASMTVNPFVVVFCSCERQSPVKR